MKIATWNLERVRPQTPQAQRQQAWFDRIDADIWVLTETHRAISPGAGYRSVSSSGPDDYAAAEGERWVQIWVRDGAIRPIPTTDAIRTACALVNLAEDWPCLIYGTVLPWMGSAWRTYPADGGKAFTEALQVQRADWVQLQRAYSQAMLIVAGDFNQDLNVLPYYGSRHNKQVLRQALIEANLECLTCGDNDPVRAVLGGQHSNIDHICVTPDPRLQIQRSFTWPDSLDELRGLSDHLGIGLEVTLSQFSGYDRGSNPRP